MRRLGRAVIAAHLVAGALLVGSPVAAADAYTIVDVGTLGGSGSSANAVNAAGDVAGTSPTSSGEPHAFRWRDGVMTGIHAMGGFGAEGWDISDDGWVAGSAGTSLGYTEAMYWFGADPNPVGRLGDFWSQAFAINDDHVIVGRSPNADGIIEAFRWQDGTIGGLGGLVDGDFSTAWDVNDDGVIVGEAGAPGGFVHAFRWADGVMTDLGTPSPNFESSWARDINEAGTIVGGTQVANGGTVHPFVRGSGAWDVITEVAGYADAVNASDQVVGTFFTSSGERAFLYEDGVTIDLNQLLPVGSSWELHAAFDINDAGQIAGVGVHDGEPRGFLMSPAVPSSDLALSVTASPDPLLAGAIATFVASVENLGPEPATNISVSVQLPVNQISASCVAPGGTCSGSGSSWTVAFASLAPGSTASATFEVRAPLVVADGVSYAAQASVQADQADPDGSNNQASASVTISNSADLDIMGTVDPRSAKPGQAVTFTFDVTNGGPGAAGSVVVTDQLPGGLELVSATSTAGTCSGSTVVSCALGTMAPGASATVTIEARITAGGGKTIVNAAGVASPTHDPQPANDSASVTVSVKGKPSR